MFAADHIYKKKLLEDNFMVRWDKRSSLNIVTWGTDKPAIKHDCGILMLWVRFAASGTNALHKVDGITKNPKILQLNLKPLARWSKLGNSWVVQQDNDKSKLAVEWINQANIKRKTSHNLNPIKNKQIQVFFSFFRMKPMTLTSHINRDENSLLEQMQNKYEYAMICLQCLAFFFADLNLRPVSGTLVNTASNTWFHFFFTK